MARRTPDARLESRESRSRLACRSKPYYRLLEPGLHVGYRRLKGRKGRAVPGTWIARHYIGQQNYVVEKIGTADDFGDADGTAILSFAQAQDKARAHMVHRAHSANGIASPQTVYTAVERYFEFLDVHGKGAVNERHRAKAYIYPTLADFEVASLTTSVLRAWLAKLAKMPARVRTKPGSPQGHRAFDGSNEAIRRRKSSANRTWTILRAALNHAFREDLVPSDAAWRKVKAFKGVDTARVKYLTIDQAQRLVNAADPEFRLLVQAALQTGCRYSELARLQVADFNPDIGMLAIRQSKSGKTRHVVLTDEGVLFFQELNAGRAENEIMLCKANGETWRASHQMRPMARACQYARIDPAINFHALRHTWASHAAMNGVPLLVIAKNLGHGDTRMVEKHYGHLAPSYIADAIRAGAPRFGFKANPKIAALRGVL
jgi:integrase